MAVLTVTPDLTNTPPRVRIDIADPRTTPATSVVISRLDADGRTRTVRTSDDGPLPLSGGIGTVFDYEVPFGTQVTYSANVTGAISVTTQINATRIWLIHPGAPSFSVPIVLRRGSNTSEDWNLDQGVFQILGRSTPIVVTSGARTAPSSTMIVGTESLAELASLRVLLADGSPLFLNVPPALGLGIDAAYIAPGNVQVTRPSDIGTDQLRDLTFTYQVVDRPIGGTQAAITWTDIAAKYATWTATVAGATSWAALAAPKT